MKSLLFGPVLVVLALPLCAQPTIDQALAGVSSGSHLRARVADGDVVEWRARRGSQSAIELPTALRNRALEGIDSLWVRRSFTMEGVIVGLILGTVPAATAMVVCEGGCRGRTLARLLIAGTSTGAIIGAMKGSEEVSWRLLFSRPRE